MTGLVQLVPEYTGSALEFVSLGRVHATADVAATAAALASWMAARGIVTGRPAAAQDGNAIVVTGATAPATGCGRSPTSPGRHRARCSAGRPSAPSVRTACRACGDLRAAVPGVRPA